jgi:hypothetical protein
MQVHVKQASKHGSGPKGCDGKMQALGPLMKCGACEGRVCKARQP